MTDTRAWMGRLLVVVLSGTGGRAEAADWTDSLPFLYTNGAGETMPYRLFLPPDPEPSREYPLVLFLHGMGELGTDNEAQVKYNIAGLIAATQSDRFKSYLVAPQSPVDNWIFEPQVHLAAEIVDAVDRNYAVDTRRIYVTGLSMGGFGTIGQLYYYPQKYAAGAPIASGIGQPNAALVAAGIWHIPIWVFHGSADSVVPVQYSRDLVQALRAAGGDPRYTEYPGVDHNSWTVTYADAGDTFYPWLFNCILDGPEARCSRSAESGEAPLEVCFSAEGSLPGEGASLTQWDWDFGDGGSGDGATPCHTYTEAGIYTITLRVTNDDGVWDQTTTTVSVHCGRQDVTPWIADDIGIVAPRGAASLEDAASGMTICAGKGMFAGATDAFHFVRQQVSGNAALSARIDSIEGSQTVARVGVMFRDGLEANARCAAVLFTKPAGGTASLQFLVRTDPGVWLESRGRTLSGVDVPIVRLRIEKRGDVISGHASTDGSDWTELGAETLPGFSTGSSVGVMAMGAFAGGGAARTLRAGIRDLSFVDCQTDIDTLCTGLVITGPDGGGPGIYRATASAEDASGDPIRYLFTAEDGLGSRMTVGPQSQETAEFDLGEGTWTISVAVDDHPMCLDASSARCQEEVKVEVGGFKRGDANASDAVDVADAIFTLSYLFAKKTPPTCLDAADANDRDMVDIADAITILSHLFAKAGPLPAPFGTCGPDPTPDDLDCASYGPCEAP